ncbi:hypothetical protein [Novosphingobium sp. FKTRR1]|nr:hypothetical protein [Novosphingobium sp. FKTRR1]
MHPRTLVELGLDGRSMPVLARAAVRSGLVVGCALALILAGKALPF